MVDTSAILIPVLSKWAIPTDRNRLRVSVLLAIGGLAVGVWATIGATASVPSVLSTLLGWITGAVAILTGWLWLASYGDRWQLPFAVTGLLIVLGSFGTWMMLETPKILLLAPFYSLALWLAVRLEQNRIEQWRETQRQNRNRTFSPDELRDDPLVDSREQTRQSDASTRYPATLRELKARLRKIDGDPWA